MSNDPRWNPETPRPRTPAPFGFQTATHIVYGPEAGFHLPPDAIGECDRCEAKGELFFTHSGEAVCETCLNGKSYAMGSGAVGSSPGS